MTREQRLINRVIRDLGEGNQALAAELLGLTQPQVSRIMSGAREPSRAVLLLAKILLKQRKVGA